jgi:hypothetical protein
MVLLSQSGIPAGLVLGVAALARRERLLWLSVICWISTIWTIGLPIYVDENG